MLLGCDFSSAPSRNKPIILATGHRDDRHVRVDQLLKVSTLNAWQKWLATQPSWIGAFDFPFGLPRELLRRWQWEGTWEAIMRRYASIDRASLREHFKQFCAARPVGGKFAHRATDGPAGASPSMKWVNPPVAWMMHAGVVPLLDTGAHFPGLGGVDGSLRVALEAYPGMLARDILGRQSYKADAPARQTSERRAARVSLLGALELTGSTRLGLSLVLSQEQRELLIADASADHLDAVLCLMLAAWAESRHRSPSPHGYGLPATIDPMEGWIVGAELGPGGQSQKQTRYAQTAWGDVRRTADAGDR